MCFLGVATLTLTLTQICDEYKRLLSHAGSKQYYPDRPAAPLSVAVDLLASSLIGLLLIHFENKDILFSVFSPLADDGLHNVPRYV